MKKTASVILFLSLFEMQAQDSLSKKEKRISLHVQETTVSQFRPSFVAAYSGAHSQTTEQEWATTITSTIFGSLRLWKNSVVAINPEIAGGHGLSSAFGIAAFTNGEAFRVGNPDPTFYLARLYLRQLIPLGKSTQWQDEGENKVAMYLPKNYVSFTIGKISVADYFDDNTFSHNARTQFMSWGLMSNGAWDYPANTRGYTPSAMIEFVNQSFEARYALSMMPTTANGNTMDEHLNKANANSLELKYKYKLKNKAGKISGIAFYNTALMGSYSAPNVLMTTDANGVVTGSYSILASRQYGRSKYGFGLNAEQYLTSNVGVFVRASYNDGKNETWCFTEIDRALSAGTMVNGSLWHRKNDYFGLAWCLSGLSPEHKNYLANGGLGFIIGDGRLNYAPEHMVEANYSLSLSSGNITPSFVYQLVINPAYNKDRGPIGIYSLRLHFTI